ncbi:hypothetical protein OUZ56_033068 [Daphnia magna]|uniref:Uncharacterized protein n=1 Tax=Daphnia magna TaxID=35525 RepID=A0ABQ9ZXD4_9CRUS|nr:hypothetical protein OUZ56_033068 [Daphnia magna]
MEYTCIQCEYTVVAEMELLATMLADFDVGLNCRAGFDLAPTASWDAVARGGLKGFGCLGAGDGFSFSTPLILLNLSAASIWSPMNFITLSMSVDLLDSDFAHSSCKLEGINLIS